MSNPNPMRTSVLLVRDAQGECRAATAEEVLVAARAVISHRVRRGATFFSPAQAREFLAVRLGAREQEVFCVAYLDTRHRLIEFVELFRGTIDTAAVYPREVVKLALHHNASAAVLVHNHPSGIAEPSVADELLTKRIVAALALVEVRVLDHMIVGGTEVVSFAERGLL